MSYLTGRALCACLSQLLPPAASTEAYQHTVEVARSIGTGSRYEHCCRNVHYTQALFDLARFQMACYRADSARQTLLDVVNPLCGYSGYSRLATAGSALHSEGSPDGEYPLPVRYANMTL